MDSYDFTKIPFDKIVRFGQWSMLHRDLFTVTWLLGRFCNYNCSYCWTHGRSDNKDHRSFSLVKSTMDEIKRQARENGFNSFHFSFSGGEPTTHPNYLDIVKYYLDDPASRYLSVHMTTNLSQGARFHEKYGDIVSSAHRAAVTASWHREQGIKKGDLDGHKKRFRDSVVALQSKDVFVTVNLVMVPEIWDELFEEAQWFHEEGINVSLKPQSNHNASKIVDGYTDEMLLKMHTGFPQRDYTLLRLKNLGLSRSRRKADYSDLRDATMEAPVSPDKIKFQMEMTDEDGQTWYMDQAERFNSFGFINFKGWDCSSGYNGIIIREPDGNIKRSFSCRDVPLGNISTGFQLFDKPMPCISDQCVTSVDTKIPKRKPGIELPLTPFK